MSTFEFVTVLLSIVVGLGITRLLGRLGRAIEIRGSLKLYWVQGVWTVNVGLNLVVFWWIVVFSYSSHEPWLFLDFVNLFLYSILLYLQAVLIIPGDLEKGTDLEAHFYSVRPWFFAIGALVPVVDVVDTLRHGLDTFLGFGPAYGLLMGSSLVLNLVAARTGNRRYHAGWSVLFLVGMLHWTATRFWTIG